MSMTHAPCARSSFITALALLLLPVSVAAQVGDWLAVTRSGDTLRNLYRWQSGGANDSLFSFTDAGRIAADGPTTTVTSPANVRCIHLRDVKVLVRERPSYFWTGVLVGTGLGVAGDIALYARDTDQGLVPFATSFGAVTGGIVGALVGVDEAYDLSTSTIEEARRIAEARLPVARTASPDLSIVLVANASPASRRVSPGSFWFTMGFGGGYWQKSVDGFSGIGALDYRHEEHLFGLRFLYAERHDQNYSDLSLHYGRAFNILGGESYLSAGPGYAWAGPSETRFDSTQAITEYRTLSISANFQQQWLVTRWFAFGASAFVGMNTRYPFGGVLFTLSVGDLD